MFRLHLPGADIIHDRISENIVFYFFRLHIFRIFFDDDRKLCLVIQLVRQIFMCRNDPVRVIRPVDALGEIDCLLRSCKLLFLEPRGFRRMIHIVDPQADNILIRLRDRRNYLNFFHWCCSGHIPRCLF